MRYCREGDLLEAEARSGCSYVWRSIIGSKAALEEGSSWRVGKGESVKVFGDRWVGSSEVNRLRGVEGAVDQELRVGALMRTPGEWNEEILQNLFTSFEREAIKRTPIKDCHEPDKRWWVLEPKGSFSVKSCYLSLMGFYKQHDHTSEEDRKMWSRLVWQVSIPPKVRVFLWRVCMNVIPTMGNLRDHHVPVDGICTLCGDRWATTEHVLLFCPKVRKVWKSSCFWQRLKGSRGAGIMEIATFMERELEVDEYAVWVILLWKVWSYVCEVTYGEKEASCLPREEESRVLRDLYERARREVGGEMRLGVRCGERKWFKPQAGVIRVDVDALYDERRNRFGVGVILRDEEGRICAAMSKPTNRKANVMIAEMMAVVEGIILSMKMAVEVISIFTDSLLVARLMVMEEEVFELLPDDIAEIIVRARGSCLEGVHHMYRTANKAAHLLAQKSSDFGTEKVWCDCFPIWLRDVVIEDSMS